MKPYFSVWVVACFWMSASFAVAKMTPQQMAALPAPAAHKIDFSKEIKPIFEASCIKCHGRGKDNGGFRLDTRETFLQGGDSGPVAASGNSSESYLIELVSGTDPDNVMPKKGSKLKPDQIALLRAWIDQGLPWDSGVNFGKVPPINLQPRSPGLPETARAVGQNPIDGLLQSYFQKHQIQPATPVSDSVFARRVYLDVIGLLPTPEELNEFLADHRSQKRQRLVERLLSDNHRYAEHWLTFWNDLLRNDYKGTGYIDDGRKQITSWLYSALINNLPYDQFVAQLINPNADSEGFSKGIVWRGVVNASQTPQMQAAQNISQVFMGVNLKCASCHDSFINDWTLADAYGLASIYADGPLEMVRCDRPTGHKASMKFLYPELGSIDSSLSKPERLKQLARVMTDEKNGRLSRTIVNRLWAKFMGRGLVEPVDDMESPAWNPDLLDWLASDLVSHGYDLKETMKRILSSQAYQMPSVPVSEQGSKEFAFRGPLVRRLTAEQYNDALASITGVWPTFPEPKVEFSGAVLDQDQMPFDGQVQPKWIWSNPEASSKAAPGTVYFRKELWLSSKPSAASVTIACDNSFKLYVNGQEAGSGKDHNKPNLIDIRRYLFAGTNLIAVAAVNDQSAPGKTNVDQSNPAGLLVYARIRNERQITPEFRQKAKGKQRSGAAADEDDGPARIPVETMMDVASDSSWICSDQKVEHWEKPTTPVDHWSAAAELGEIGMAPWDLKTKFRNVMAAGSLYGHVRASLVTADPLMVALGRPNREQVMTTRSSVATTLQALEMTNGKTLAQQLETGAEELLQENGSSGRHLAILLYERALSRKPTDDELRLAEDLIGTSAKKEGVEDLLWAMTMLPEFQLIY